MTEQNGNTGPGKKPDFVAYNVNTAKDGKGHWNRIGAAWKHNDGQGYEVQLESLPVDGRVTLREMRQTQMQGYEEQQQAQRENPQPEQAQAMDQTMDQSHGQTR